LVISTLNLLAQSTSSSWTLSLYALALSSLK